jgi:hypothetical protein
VLGNLSLRPKIALILLLPVAALLLLAGLRIGSSVSTSRQAAQVRDLTEFALRGTALAHELQRERGLTLGGLLAGRPGTGLRDQRVATNQALAAYRDSAADLDQGALDEATAERLASAANRLAGLTDLRRDVSRNSIAPAAALDAFNTTIADLLNTNRGLASGIADPQLAQQVGAFVAVSRIKELAALERELVSEVLDRGRFAPGQFRRFTSTLATRAVLLSEFRGAATDAQRAVFVDTLVGPEVQRARELQAAAVAGEGASRLDIDPAEWWTVNSTEIDLLRRVEDRLGAAAVDASRADETAARNRAAIDAAGVLVVLVLAIGLSLVVVRSLLRPLGLLRSSAEEVAHSQLPAWSSGSTGPSRSTSTPRPGPSASPTTTRSARWPGPSTPSTRPRCGSRPSRRTCAAAWPTCSSASGGGSRRWSTGSWSCWTSWSGPRPTPSSCAACSGSTTWPPACAATPRTCWSSPGPSRSGAGATRSRCPG